jgi:uncharacterized membrane protein
MMQIIITGLLWFSALGCGLLGGLYFAFSAFVMTALGRIDPAAGISAMNAVNETIVRSWFMPLFLGTTAASLALAGLALARWQAPAALMMVVGGVIYIVGMFVVTMVFNVPLNNALAGATPNDPATGSLWARYLSDWTFWNHVRTIASTVSSALFIAAIASGQAASGVS